MEETGGSAPTLLPRLSLVALNSNDVPAILVSPLPLAPAFPSILDVLWDEIALCKDENDFLSRLEGEDVFDEGRWEMKRRAADVDEDKKN
jgi:hypothetical protein